MSRTCVLEDMNSQCGLFKFQVWLVVGLYLVILLSIVPGMGCGGAVMCLAWKYFYILLSIFSVMAGGGALLGNISPHC